jgi:ribosomal protein S18 acetylase RimI-like enzyme
MGVFAKLYQHIKNMVESSESITGIRLYVDKSNEKARAVYEKMGMNGHHYSVFEDMKRP